MTTQAPRSDRRSARSHQAVLQAALNLCREQGYAAVTIEGIAARAGVGKQTIYRWWPSKGAVVLDAFMDTIATEVALPETGDHLEEIRLWLRSVAALLASTQLGPHLAGLVGARQSDAALAQAFHQQVYLPVRAAFTERIQLAQQAGQLRPTEPEVVADLLISPLWFRLLVAGDPASPEHIDAVFDAALGGLRP